MGEPLTTDELAEAHDLADDKVPATAVVLREVIRDLLAEVKRLREQVARSVAERDAFKAAAADMARYREAEVAALRKALDTALETPTETLLVARAVTGAAPTFADLLADPTQQFDPTSEVLRSILAYQNAHYRHTIRAMKVKVPTLADTRLFIAENTWLARDPETGRHHRNGHLIDLDGCEWRCQICRHWFDAAVDADLFRCGDACVHPTT